MSETARDMDLSSVRGKWLPDTQLGPFTWLRVGGPAEYLFLPADAADLAMALAQKPENMPHWVLGAGSNLLIRDGGVRGMAIRLGPSFGKMQVEAGNRIRVGAGALDKKLAGFAAQEGIAGLSFYAGIPGTIGGALRMNAGCYDYETKDVLIEAVAIDGLGRRIIASCDELAYSYRHCGAPKDWVFIEALFQGEPGESKAISAQMDAITSQRQASQPVREKTGGSTFKNPDGHKSWQLIDAAGGRGLRVGGAQMSEQHCNFMKNTDQACAADLEELGEEIRRRVKANSDIELQWEIRRIGDKP